MWPMSVRTCLASAFLFAAAQAFGGTDSDPATADDETCPPVLSAIVEDKNVLLEIAYAAGITDFLENVVKAQLIGTHTALIAEASDAIGRDALIVDGMSGDVDFPYGDLKVLATVGEMNGRGEFFVGVPDGQGAYLTDDETLRLLLQSESYGPAKNGEAFPWMINGGTASLTGSHIQYFDFDRELLTTFMDHSDAASTMIKDFGRIGDHMYNLKGELVGPRNRTGPTTHGAHISNCDADGNYVVGEWPEEADWVMQSLCSANLVVKHQWGDNIGVEDTLFITNEEWNALPLEDGGYDHGTTNFTGLAAHVIDLEENVIYALGVFTLGGFEKIVEFSSGCTDYVAFAVSGYNGKFGDPAEPYLTQLRNHYYGNRANDNKPYVYTKDIVANRIYIGKKGVDVHGDPADDFVSRNGLAYGQMYGFAVNTTEYEWRDTFHKGALNGATVEGGFYPVNWRWDGVVRNYEHDGSWQYQEHPVGAPEDVEFWTGKGPDKAAAKTEHVSSNPMGEHGFFQGSTAGYVGHYLMETLPEILAKTTDLPESIPATYQVLVGETAVNEDIELGGKGMKANGEYQTTMTDGSKTHVTFEDVDGLEVFAAADGMYILVNEDGSNLYGERTFLGKISFSGEPLKWHFIAQSGGFLNTRNKANVGIPAGVNSGSGAHEFSGSTDLSGFLAKDSDGIFKVSAADTGRAHREAAAAVAINDKYITVGLQAHNFNDGIIKTFRGDRGGQLYLYQPNV